MMSAIEQAAHSSRAAHDLHKERCPICSRSLTYIGMCPEGQVLDLQKTQAAAEAFEENRRLGRTLWVKNPPKPEYMI